MATKDGRKTGGRKRGTPNKPTPIDYVARALKANPDYNPFHKLIEMATTSREETIRLAAHKEIAKYVAPQLRAIDHTGEVSGATIIAIGPSFDFESIKEVKDSHMHIEGEIVAEPKPPLDFRI